MKALLGRGQKLQLYGTDYPTPDGSAIRDYIHVCDLADAHVRALEHLASGGETVALNVGTGSGSSVRQVIEAAEAVAGRPVPVELCPRRAGDPVAVYADNTRVRQLLEWSPKFGLTEIVSTAWRWHSTHPEGYTDKPS